MERRGKTMKRMEIAIVVLCFLISSFAGCGKKADNLTYEQFKELTPEDQIGRAHV